MIAKQSVRVVVCPLNWPSDNEKWDTTQMWFGDLISLEVQSRKTLDTAHDLSTDEISDIGPGSGRHIDVEVGTSVDTEIGSGIAAQEKAYGASWFMQFQILFRRAIKVRRFEALALQDLSQALSISILAGSYPALSRCILCQGSHDHSVFNCR